MINYNHCNSYDEIPQWFKKWEDTGLIKFNDLNEDGVINHKEPMV